MFEFSDPTIIVGAVSAMIGGATVRVTMTNQQNRLPDLLPSLITEGGETRLRLTFTPGTSSFRVVSVSVKNCLISSQYEVQRYDGVAYSPIFVGGLSEPIRWRRTAYVDVVIRSASAYASYGAAGDKRRDCFIWVDFLFKPLTSMDALEVVVTPPLIDRLRLSSWRIKERLPLYDWIFPEG